MDLEAEIDRLYALPLDEFVAERGAAAKRLRAAGEREAAERVKALRKPTAGAWALNQAVRRRRAETTELLAAGERLRAAHELLLSGGDPSELRAAMAQERELAGVLADCAEAIASETGKSGPALRERVRSTLHAAALDETVREQLAAGRLLREQEAVGLGAFGAAPVEAAPAQAPRRAGPPKRRPARGGDDRDRSAKAERARAAAEREQAAEREREAALEEAESQLAETRAALAEAETAQARAAEAAEAAHAAAKEAERAEREAGKLARERRREVARQERAVERLRISPPR